MKPYTDIVFLHAGLTAMMQLPPDPEDDQTDRMMIAAAEQAVAWVLGILPADGELREAFDNAAWCGAMEWARGGRPSLDKFTVGPQTTPETKAE